MLYAKRMFGACGDSLIAAAVIGRSYQIRIMNGSDQSSPRLPAGRVRTAGAPAGAHSNMLLHSNSLRSSFVVYELPFTRTLMECRWLWPAAGQIEEVEYDGRQQQSC